MKDELPNEILNFTTLKILHDTKRICNCKNVSYEIDEKNRLVTCTECGAYTDPFDALVCLTRRKEKYINETKRLFEQRKQILNYKPHLLVFRRLEEEYRKTKRGQMLPSCPKCNQLFKFEDIMVWGNSIYYKED